MTLGADRIAIVGVGGTPPVRRSPRGIRELVVEACLAAIADAGLQPSDIDGLVTDVSYMPLRVPADEVALALGLPVTRFSAHGLVGGAGVVGAPELARLAIASGRARHVLSYYGADFGSAESGPYAFPVALDAKAALEMPFGWYGQPLYFAAMAQRYRHLYGLTPEEQAQVPIAARAHAARTPGALRAGPFGLADYLAAPMIAEPFRSPDCSVISDGAAAFVMTTVERARDLRKPPIVVAGIGTASSPFTQADYFTQHSPYPATPAAISAPRAFAEAGLGPADIDIVEPYDCFTITTLLQLEECGFCGRGEAGNFVADGRTGPGGSLPVNTHGGLLAHSYLIGAEHVTEAVRQLRGERGAGQVHGAEVALVTGLGVPDHATLILTTDR
jgi:acetyl-CoA acetyltransferase